MKPIKLLPPEEIVKAYVISVLYFFVLTVVATLVLTVYGYFYPIDMTSERSVLTVGLIFFSVLLIDFGLLFFGKPTPAIIAMVIVIAPIMGLYKLFIGTDFIQIDRGTPAKLRKYVPPRFISA